MIKSTLAKEFTKIIYGEAGVWWALFYACIAFFIIVIIPYLILRRRSSIIKDIEKWIVEKVSELF